MKAGIFAVRDYRKSKDLPKFKLAAKKLDIDIDFYSPKDIFIKIDNNKVQLFLKNGEEVILDGAINWIPYAKYDEICHAFSSADIPYINSVEAVRNCRNKVLTNIILAQKGFPQPKTIYYPQMMSPSEVQIDLGYPFIYKNKNGSHGIDSKKFNSDEDVKNFFDGKYSRDSLYFQEYIKNNGYDYRILVVNDKVIGGIRKHYKKGEWRTHVAHGGTVEVCSVPNHIKKICVNIMRALNLHFAGIDIMTDVNDNVFILEVNSVPGMDIFYNLTGINLAQEILIHLNSLMG